MSREYEIEVLLRPPIEFYTTAICAMSAVFIGLCYESLFMTWELALGTIVMLLVFGGVRFKSGFEVIRYQKGLRGLPPYKLRSDQIETNDQTHFIGRGFRWQERHTQRVHDVRDTQNEKFVKKSKFGNRDRETLAERLGGYSYLHGVGLLEEHDVRVQLTSRAGQTIYYGSTQVGKTRTAEVNITQDISRKNRLGEFNNVVIVIDPKGDSDLLKRTYLEARRNGRLDQFYVFHLGQPDQSVRYNPIGSYSRITEVASRIAGQLPNEGNASAFKEFGWLFTNLIAGAMVRMGEIPTYKRIRQYLWKMETLFKEYMEYILLEEGAEVLEEAYDTEYWTELKARYELKDQTLLSLIAYIHEREMDDNIVSGLLYALSLTQEYFDKITISLNPFLDKLSSEAYSSLLSPDYSDMEDDRRILDWGQVIRQRGVVYVGLDALSDAEVATVVGESMFADLTSYAGRIYKEGIYEGLDAAESMPPRITIHADEFSDLVGPRFATMLNKCGAAGMELVLYSQTVSDLTARLGKEAKSGQIIGNLNTIVMLRVKEPKTAELITKVLPKVKVHRLTVVSGVMDAQGSDATLNFVSSNQDRITEEMVPMIDVGDLSGLPIGQAFSLSSGNQLHKLRIPLPAEDKEDDQVELPRYLSEMMAYMKQNYRSGINLGTSQ